MKFVKVKRGEGNNSNENSVTWDAESMPELEGRLIDNLLNVGAYNNKLWKVETDEGVTYSVWSSTVLDDILGKVAMGSYIKLVYLGKKKKKKGVGLYKDYDLFVAEDVEPVVTESATTNDDTDEEPLPF